MFENKINNRRSIRLKAYNYSQPGYYFVTLCCKNRNYYFEAFPVLKNIVDKNWYKLSERFRNIELDEFIIMPNHLHGIIRLKDENSIKLGDIIGAFKSITTNEWLKYIKENNLDIWSKFWHWNYFERIIRDERQLENTREYIRNNPLNWENDKFYIPGKNNKTTIPVRAGLAPAPTNNESHEKLLNGEFLRNKK